MSNGRRARAIVAALPLLLGLFELCDVPRFFDTKAPRDLVVELAGCDVVRLGDAGTACDMAAASVLAGAGRGDREGRRLTMWVEAARGATVTLRLDGKRVEGKPMQALPSPDEQGIAPLELEVPEGASELRVTVEVEGRPSERRFPLFTQAPSRDRAQLARVKELRGEKKPDEARRLCEPLTGSADPIVRARATGQLARLARGNDRDRAISLLYAAMALDHEAGLLSDEIGDGLVLAKDLVEQRSDLTAASEVLDHLAAPLDEEPVGRALALHYRGLLAEARGDLAGAIDLHDRSARLSRRLGLAGHLSDVYQKKLILLALIGIRSSELRAALESLPPAPAPCSQATRFVNLAWYALLGYDARDAAVAEQTLAEAERELKKAAALYADGCDARFEQQNVFTDLAHVALARGRNDEADGYLAQAMPDVKEAKSAHAADWELTVGRLLLQRGSPAAARPHLAAAATLSRDAGLREPHVGALFGLAELDEALGRTDEALARYAEANALLNQWSGLIPFGLGKQVFFGQSDHERGVRRYLALLTRRAQESPASDDRPRHEASCVARRSRARLRVFAEWRHRIAVAPAEIRAELDDAVKRYALSLSPGQAALEIDRIAGEIGGAPDQRACDQPAADEVLLVYHPLPDGWVGFAVTSRGTVVRPLDVREEDIRAWQKGEGATGPSGEAAAAKLLAPFADVLADVAVRRVRFLPAGPLGSVELHRLPWKGGTLGERFSITYGVDAFRAPAPTARGKKKKALVVAISGESGELYRTRTEAERVASALRGEGYEPIVRIDEEATFEEIRRLLQGEDVELFHYAGHSFRTDAPDAWGSNLSLANQQSFTVDDVLQLKHVPRRVVLSSCVTDAAGDRVFAAGLGVAPAFVIAGADVAVALVGSPKDALMMKIMSALYGDHLRSFLLDPATAVRETVTELSASRELRGVDLPPLRVLVR